MRFGKQSQIVTLVVLQAWSDYHGRAIPMSHDNPQLQKTVLVVACSDSPVMSVVSRVLSSWKFECARDNEEALALVEKSAFDLVITDQASSGREDAELLRDIRLVRPHTRL